MFLKLQQKLWPVKIQTQQKRNLIKYFWKKENITKGNRITLYTFGMTGWLVRTFNTDSDKTCLKSLQKIKINQHYWNHKDKVTEWHTTNRTFHKRWKTNMQTDRQTDGQTIELRDGRTNGYSICPALVYEMRDKNAFHIYVYLVCPRVQWLTWNASKSCQSNLHPDNPAQAVK